MVKKKKVELELPHPIETLPVLSFDNVVSTNSTLLDLAISGGAVTGGGIPGGILVEVFGPPGCGKTALLAEVCGNAIKAGGEVLFADPEGRLNQEYAKIYGLHIKKENYFQPDTIEEVLAKIMAWGEKERPSDVMDVFAVDSIAALSTVPEMEGKDKRGQTRAKMFSEMFRRTARIFSNKNKLLLFSNQERQGDMGWPVTPGGKAIGYYCSVRIKMIQKQKMEKSVTIDGILHKEVIGIYSNCEIKKNSVDSPYREAPVTIFFGSGIQNIYDCVEYLKNISKSNSIKIDEKEYKRSGDAVRYILQNNKQEEIVKQATNRWYKVREKFDEVLSSSVEKKNTVITNEEPKE